MAKDLTQLLLPKVCLLLLLLSSVLLWTSTVTALASNGQPKVPAESWTWAGVMRVPVGPNLWAGHVLPLFNNTSPKGPIVASIATQLVDVAWNDSRPVSAFNLQQQHTIDRRFADHFEGVPGPVHSLTAQQPSAFKPITFYDTFGPCTIDWMRPTKQPYPGPLQLQSSLASTARLNVKTTIVATVSGVQPLSNKQHVTVPVAPHYNSDFFLFQYNSHFDVVIKAVNSDHDDTIGHRFHSLIVGCGSDAQVLSLLGNKARSLTHRFKPVSGGWNFITLTQAANVTAAPNYTLYVQH
eukprot:TRINITY_DN2827_c0_g1_i1.p1 TRINITY_DN2827_c0_g1~~TRINITY_DN2827_c0_g1_i1.p1  ORF type:complete len:295 (-),score=45.56 TRINITY_DN2827_c0_g1_i1:189-1073(-)